MKVLRDKGVQGQAVTGKTNSPSIQIIDSFPIQSYFDTTLGPRAILVQPQGQQIVPSTLKTSAIAGYAIGLHPSSQTPVAVRFQKGAQAGDSGVITLKPGQVVKPNGDGAEGVDGRFSGFQYGCPFGWLGGGNFTLVVFRTNEAKVDWIDRTELIFHRERLQILTPANVPAAANVVPNWPLGFPWQSAERRVSTADIPQGGSPILTVTPTRIAMSLRLSSLAAAASMRMYFIGTTDFSMDVNGDEDLTIAPVSYDVVWGAWASIASAQYATQYQFQFLPVEAFRLGSQYGAVVLVSQDIDLQEEYVDVIRYGVL